MIIFTTQVEAVRFSPYNAALVVGKVEGQKIAGIGYLASLCGWSYSIRFCFTN
jgi:hypothetical protein